MGPSLQTRFMPSAVGMLQPRQAPMPQAMRCSIEHQQVTCFSAHICATLRIITSGPQVSTASYFSEILLNAAEALNEAGQTEQAYQYVNQVRARVGMPAYSGMTQAKLRDRIRNERRVELAFEDHRWFDERRWKLFEGKSASSERNLPRYQQVYNLYGVHVTPNASTVYNYVSEQNHPTRVFNSPKNYLFPIPDSETKMLSKLKQNTGWEMSDTKEDTSSESSE